jgi:signal transduction histidine kinase
VRAAAEMAELRSEHDQLVRRLVDAGVRERRRIERALHDGAQQGLVALRIRLSLLQERLEEAAPDEAPAVEQLGRDVEVAIDQVRTLAKGIYPSLLAQHGIGAALRAAVREAPLPVTVDAGVDHRCPVDVEAAVYFTCMEAVQNAFKHAEASVVHARLIERDGELCFSVADDGRGFDPGSEGSGLTGMRDRMAAVGGRLTIDSRNGVGTTVSGCVPAAVLSARPPPGARPNGRRRGTSRPPSRAG